MSDTEHDLDLAFTRALFGTPDEATASTEEGEQAPAAENEAAAIFGNQAAAADTTAASIFNNPRSN